MFCSQCGKQNTEGTKYCVYCGASLNVYPAREEQNITKTNKQKKKTGLTLAIVILVFLLFMALILSALFLFEKRKDDKKDGHEQTIKNEKIEESLNEDTTDLDDKSSEELYPEKDGKVTNLEIAVGEVYDSEYSEVHHEFLISSTISKILLGVEEEEKYPELAQTLKERNESEVASMKREYDQALSDATIHIQESPEMFYSYEISETASIRRADSNVTSILITGYGYYGGNHGSTYYKCENYDSKTGQKLLLTDVVTDTSLLPSLIMEAFVQSGESAELFPEIDMNEYVRDNVSQLVWTLDYNGISFYFGSYEIASYAAGTQLATISYKDHPQLIKEEYQKVPDAYAVHLADSENLYYDLDADGILDNLYIRGISGDNNDRDLISVNGVEYEFPTNWENNWNEAVLLHNADGNHYLYMSISGYSDDYILNIYAFQNGAVSKVGTMNDSFWYHTQKEDDECYYKFVINNPQSFKLGTGTDLLSTVPGYKTYSVGANGMPETKDNGYMFKEDSFWNQYLKFTVLQSVKAQEIEKETGTAIGEKTLVPGTKVYYFRTDDRNYADLILEDGTVVRVFVDSSDWPTTIEGKDIEEVFEGLFWAG